MSDSKFPPEKNLPAGYEPPKVWTWEPGNGGAFASTNRPIAGSTHEQELKVGKHPLQLYSLGTPNGQKVTILLEELLEAVTRVPNTMPGSSISARAISSVPALLVSIRIPRSRL